MITARAHLVTLNHWRAFVTAVIIERAAMEAASTKVIVQRGLDHVVRISL